MSSEGSNSSEEEGGEAYDLLAKIQKQLNQEHNDEEEEEDEDEQEEQSKAVLDQDQNKNKIRDAAGNKEEQNNQQSNAQSDDVKKEANSIGEAANPVAQQNESSLEVANGISNNTILEQNQITSNQIDSSSSSSETASNSINTQIPQVNLEKQSSSASSQQQQQSLSPSKNLIASQSTQSSEQILAAKQNEIPANPLAPSSAVVTVRNEAIKKEEAQDNLISALERITLTRNLLEDEDILGHRIDSYALEQTLESVRRRFDENMLRFSSKQKAIFDRIRDITRRSTLVAEQTNSSAKIFAKKKQADKEKHVKDVQRLSNDAAKTKTFLLMMITRLEAIEHDVDKLTDTQLKKTALAESKVIRENAGAQVVPENKNNAANQVEEEEQKQQK